MEWFLINTHLIPSFILFFIGIILLITAPVVYQLRRRKVIILNPIKAIKEYSKIEKIFFIVGTILTILGLISLVIIAEYYGYYYFENGVPTFFRK